MKILVTGGAGYIGSICAHELKKAGHEVVIFDSLQHGDRERVKDYELVIGETTDFEFVKKTLAQHKIEAVMHFAAWIEMGESMVDPGKYFHNNVNGALQLLRAMVDVKVDKLIFSSTAGVYGNPVQIPIKEDDPKTPVNPYGESKLMVERMLRWFDQIHHLRSITIRYFNAAGALLDGSLGEAHEPESHLIPNIIKAVQEKREFTLFGDDYETFDGTCVRDYIHVLDLASAHIMALQVLSEGHATNVYNAGTGQGYSNKQIIEMVEKVTGQSVRVNISQRRPGDANELIADSTKLQQDLGWKPQYSDLETIVTSAWKWHNR
ncbi:UDP-glucose 4-epimerase GalE [Candidatus Beckwithbacteria bacterium]|nr:UDP-glucose 4-epimerase GalE [Candidatus Beckwithbacteria bacterium]